MTITLVQSVTIGVGGANAIEFTGIEATGKDLLVLIQTRNESISTDNLDFLLNNDTGTNYSWQYLRGSGNATVASITSSFTRGIIENGSNGTNFTADVFSNTSFYVLNYTSNTTKSILVNMVNENSGVESYQVIQAFSYNTTSAISSVKFYLNGGTDLAQNSTASLYIIS